MILHITNQIVMKVADRVHPRHKKPTSYFAVLFQGLHICFCICCTLYYHCFERKGAWT